MDAIERRIDCYFGGCDSQYHAEYGDCSPCEARAIARQAHAAGRREAFREAAEHLSLLDSEYPTLAHGPSVVLDPIIAWLCARAEAGATADDGDS